MAGLGDWTRYTTSGYIITLDLTTPLVQSSSLKMRDDASNSGAAHLHLNDSFDRGFTRGSIKTIIRLDSPVTTGGTSAIGGGIVCMQSQLDIRTSGAAYIFNWGRPSSGSTPASGNFRFSIDKMFSGLALSGSNVSLAQTADIPVVAGAFYPIEIEWDFDNDAYGGVRLRANRGTLNSIDFNTLSPLFDVIDSSSPLTTSLAEGLYIYESSNSAGRINVSCDETIIAELE